MSFLSGILDVGKSVVGFLSGNSIWSGLAKTAIMGYALNRLNSNTNKGSDAGKTANIDNGVRVTAPNASTAHYIPVLYGTAWFPGKIFDVRMSADNKTMFYAIALAEKTGSTIAGTAPSYTFKDVYWNNQRVEFKADGITVNLTRDRVGNEDRNLENQVKIYFYAGNSTSGIIPENYTGTVPAAYSIFPNWTAGTHTLDNLIFAIVRVDYNREKNVTGLADLQWQVANTVKYPGDVLYDYMTSTRYGAAIPAGDIDTTSLTALNTYAQETVTYTYRALNGTVTPGTVLDDRYQINGLIDTEQPILENIEKIGNAAATWLSYDNYDGKWGVIVNKAGTSVASFSDANILGTISVSGTGLRETYNAAKVEFPDRELRDGANFVSITLDPSLRNANEIPKTLPLAYDIINDPVQAKLLGFIELKQSRVDKVIQFQTDFSKINLKPGDIIDVTNSRLSFTSKLFRIISISEVQEDGALMCDITALEYDSSVYSTADMDKYEVTNNDEIETLGAIGAPGQPQITKVEQDTRPRIVIESTSPTFGIVEAMEFWLTTDTTVPDDANRNYSLIRTVRPTQGATFGSGTNVTAEYDSLSATNFLIKTRGINGFVVGPYSLPAGTNFVPTPVAGAIDPNTKMFDSTGGLLTGLALVSLAQKLLDLFGSNSGKSIFERVFDVFKDTTGVDLVGEASGGSLVVASQIAIQSNGSQVATQTSSINFKNGLQATASGTNITAKIIDGTKHKDILVWNNDDKEWVTVSDCIQCEPPNTPPGKGPEEDCYLKLKSTLPTNNFQGADALCPNTTSVPHKGSYFAKFEIIPGREGADPVSPASITASTDFQWTIAKTGNTDWTFWGAPAEAVGTKWFAKLPATLFPNGKTLKEIVVGKKYKIKTVGDGTAAEKKTAWEAVGWEAETPTSVPTANDEFIATAQGTEATRLVDYVAGTGFAWGQGTLKPSIAIVAPLVKGTGSIKLYGTDGVLQETVAIGSCKIHGDVLEIPFKDRAPGKDYYVIYDEGIITSCACENQKVDSDTVWTFTTAEGTATPYQLSQIAPKTFADNANNDDTSIRTRVDFSYTPVSSVCSNSQKLILTFGQKVKKGTGVITIKDRMTQSTVATLPVASATITQITDTNNWKVDFGTIPTLDKNKYFDINAPVGLLLTDTPASSETVCDKVTQIPAEPDRQSKNKDWGFKTDEELKIVSYEYCKEASGNARKRTNIRITFNKPIKLKEGTAEVEIYSKGLFGGLFQKIDLRGTYANKKYGDIYDATSSVTDNPDTANNEATSNSVILVNPTAMMKGNTEYYINIASGVIIDAVCDVPFAGITDQTTVAWKTDGADPTPPNKPTYGSYFIDFKFDRNVVPGEGKLNIISPTGVLLKQISATDFALKYKHNTPFGG